MSTHPCPAVVAVPAPAASGLRGLLGALQRNGVRRATLHALARDTTLSLRPGRLGLALTARRGTLVVTQEGDLEDHVLEPGEQLHLPSGGGLVVAWAVSDAEAEVLR